MTAFWRLGRLVRVFVAFLSLVQNAQHLTLERVVYLGFREFCPSLVAPGQEQAKAERPGTRLEGEGCSCRVGQEAERKARSQGPWFCTFWVMPQLVTSSDQALPRNSTISHPVMHIALA